MYKWLIIVGFYGLSCLDSIYAQTSPNFVWQNFYGDGGDDGVNALYNYTDTSYLIAGMHKNKEGHFDTRDFQFFEVNHHGKSVRQKKCYQAGDDYINQVLLTKDHGFIVVGQSECYGGDGRNTHSNIETYYKDIGLFRYDSIGNLVWKRCFGTSGDENNTVRILNAPQGGYYIISAFGDEYVDGDVTDNHGKTDAWLLKVSEAGDLEWQRNYGGSSWDEFYSGIVLPKDSTLLLIGISRSNDFDVSNNSLLQSCWIVRLDSNGTILNSTNSLSYDTVFSVVGMKLDSDGNAIAYGNASWHVPTPEVYQEDACFAKIFSNGQLDSLYLFGGSKNESFTSLLVLSDGKLLFGGATKSKDRDLSGYDVKDEDAWVIKTSTGGGILEQGVYGYNDKQGIVSLLLLPSGNLLCLGYNYSNSIKDFYYEGSDLMPPDAWMFEISSISLNVTNHVKDNQLDLLVYPNPTNDNLNIMIQKDKFNEIKEVRIVDLLGRVVLQSSVENLEKDTDRVKVNIGSIPLGNYIVEIIGEFGRVCRMVMVM